MRCLVTGADGFLGANLCRLLMRAGHEVVGAALERGGCTGLEALGVRGMRVEYGDINSAGYVYRIVNAYEAEWVFHLAAVSIVRIAASDPQRAIYTSVTGTLNVVESAQRNQVRRVLIASSDKAYGDHGGEPYTEDMPLQPSGAYEVSKACADQIGRLYGATVIRCANLYGAGDLNWSRLIPNSCRRALAGEAPAVYGDTMNDRREWLYVEDAARAYMMLAELGEAGAYNVGSGEQASPMEMAATIARLANGPDPAVAEKEKAFYEIPRQELRCEKIEGLGWRPEVRLAEGLARTVAWYREYLAYVQPIAYSQQPSEDSLQPTAYRGGR